MDSPHLEITVGGQTRQLPFDVPAVTVGRHQSNTLVLSDGMASRSHCVIEKAGNGTFRVRDLNSSNGTRLNGQIIRTAVLAPGDVITIGKTEIRLVGSSNGEDVETLDEGDLVEVDPDIVNAGNFGDMEAEGGGTGALRVSTEDVDYEHGLQSLAEQLPPGDFGESDIALVNARGVQIHEAGSPHRGKGRREPVDLFRLLLLVCFRSRTTDIHIEPRQDHYGVRLRIDGSMVDVARLPSQVGHRLASLVKVLSDIDIAQRNSIQEGHYAAKVPSPKLGGVRRVDYRVSFAPAVFGQKLVIRVLDTANAPLRAGDLNLPKWMLEEVHVGIKQDAGMVLVAGPTGSGKTTSLYALLRSIEVARRNVVTIEDPVEIQLEGVTQIPVSESQERSFSQLLRSVLRQDPDVILVGEIRDAETARIAMQAAITGHLVFSTVHTKDTIGTIFRLLDLGVEPYLVAQGLHIVIAQRLARQLCQYCKRPVPLNAEQRAAMGPMAENVYKTYVPVGCQKCLGTGFSGRRAFFEMLKSTEQLRDVILKSPTMGEIQQALAGRKFLTLQQNGYQLVADGLVPFAEIDRAVGRDMRAV